MPDTLPPLSINIQAVTSALESGLNNANAQVSKFAANTVAKLDLVNVAGKGLESTFKSFFNFWNIAGAALAGGGLVAGLHAADAAASRVRTSLDEAANSVHNLGGSLDTVQLKAFVENLATGAAAGVASTTDLFNAVQTLGIHVHNTAQLERAMGDAVQLAAATHEDFGTAVNQVARGLSGYITIMVRAGLITKDEATHIHSVEQAMEVLADKTKNATGNIDANEKAWGRLQNTLQNIQIEIGDGMAPAMLKAENGLNDWLNTLVNLVPDMQALTVAVVDFFQSVGEGLRALRDFAGELEHLAAGIYHTGTGLQDMLERNFKGAADQARAAVEQFHDLKAAFTDLNSIQFDKLSTYADIFGTQGTGKVAKPSGGGSGGSSDFEGGIGKAAGTGGKGERMAPAWAQFVVRPEFGTMGPDMKALLGQTFGAKGSTPKDMSGEFTAAMLPLEDKLEAIRTQGALEKARGTDTPEKEAQRAAEIAKTQAALADLAVAAAQAKKAFDAFKGGDTQADEAALNKAIVDQKKAQDDLKIASVELDMAFKATHVTLSGIASKLQETVGSVIPGIFGTAAQRVTSFSDFLAQALQRSPAWLDIQNVMQHVMYAVAQVFTALRPIIDLFLKILVGVVNGLLSAWNLIAKLLSLLGIHVAQLQLITDAFSSLTAPLIRIVHDIPTLNELATNNVAPLHPSQYYSQLSNQMQPAMNAQTSVLKEIGAVLVAGLALWIISNALHLLHIGATVAQTGVLTAGEVATVAQLGIANALLAAILVKPSFAGFTFCPLVDQQMETREHGFIRAGDLAVGDHLRADDGCEWHEIYTVEIKPTTGVRSVNEIEALDVNWNHCFKDKDGEWVAARLLETGDELLKATYYGGGTIKIVETVILGPSQFAAIDCEHHEYIIGRTIGHNNSGGFMNMMRDVHDAVRGGAGGSTTVHSPISMQAHFYGDMSNIGDIEQAGKALAEGAARAQRSRGYLVDRVN